MGGIIMTLAQLLEWLEAIEAEFGNLKITKLNMLPIHQNRVEVDMQVMNNGQPQTHMKTFDRSLLVPQEGHRHP